MRFAGTVIDDDNVKQEVEKHVSGLSFKSDANGNIHAAFGKA